MAIEKTLRFVKDPTGLVFLYGKENKFLASFNPAQSIIRENDHSDRFRIVSDLATAAKGFVLDYRTIDYNSCEPSIDVWEYPENLPANFIEQLSRKFFNGEKKKLTGFFIGATQKNPCDIYPMEIPKILVYHDGHNAFPLQGDIVYADSASNSYYPVGCYTYNDGIEFIGIGHSGVVNYEFNCTSL